MGGGGRNGMLFNARFSFFLWVGIVERWFVGDFYVVVM
jgi:hypothetical protein